MVSYSIFSDDSYGKPFYQELISRLKKEGIIKRDTIVYPLRLPGKCYHKSERAIKAANQSSDKICIIADAEGPQNRTATLKEIDKHIPEEIKIKVRIVILDYMVEEWVCESLGLKYGGRNPSEVLNEHLMTVRGTKKGYEKSQLPDFVNDLNIDILLEKSSSFNAFVSFLPRQKQRRRSERAKRP